MNVVRAYTDQQMESRHTNGPPVRAAAIWLLRQDFWCNTACRSHQRAAALSHACINRSVFWLVVIPNPLTQPKVNQANPRFTIEHHVVQFEIAVDKSGSMHNIHCESQGREVVSRQNWREWCLSTPKVG